MGSTKRAAALGVVLWTLASQAQEPSQAPDLPVPDSPAAAPELPAAAPELPAASPPSAESEQDSAIIRRAGFTPLGEVIGAGLPMLVGGAFFNKASCNMFSGCDDTSLAVASSALPVLAQTGGSIGHYLGGGRAGPGFGLAGMLAGYVLGLTFLSFVSLAMGREWSQGAPAAGAGILGVLGAAGGVAGMELRHRALLDGSRSWNTGRIVLTTLAFMGPVIGLSLGLGFLASWYFISSDSVLLAATLTVGFAATALVSSLAGWAAHRAMGGVGRFPVALLGSMVGLAAAALFFFSHFWSPVTPQLWHGQDGVMFVPIGGITAGIAAAGPAVALEWYHARTAPPEEGPKPAQQEQQLSLGISPTKGGGAMVGLGLRF
jgi:hypothetical protein